ncbi:MAG: GldG family protein [Bauldia sp.]|nr:GldG family protein [Bauldia sp.]
MFSGLQNASRTTIAVLSIILAIVLFLCINLVATLTLGAVRIDATEGKLYSVSDDTRQVLEDLTDPIKLRLYLSTSLRDQNASIRAYSGRVIELLRTYQTLSGGQVDFELINPAPLSRDEEDAASFNLYAETTGLDPGYFGLVGTNTTDGIEVIPFLNVAQESALEYQLTRMVSRLSKRELRNIGIVDGLGIMTVNATQTRRWQIVDSLAEDFNVINVPLDFTVIPQGYDAIVVVHPFALAPSGLYALEQYAMRGGNLVVFLDPQAEHSLVSPTNPNALANPDSYLLPLTTAWGIEMQNDLVVADPSLAVPIIVGGQQGAQQRSVDYLPWISLNREIPGLFNPEDPVTAPLTAVMLESPGSLRPIPGATTTFTPLLTTTNTGGVISQAMAMARNPQQVLQNFVPSGAQVVAARITGPIRTAFPGGPPPLPEVPAGAEVTFLPPPELIRESVEDVNIIVIADTDLLANDVIEGNLRYGPNNADFVTNAIESVTGGTTLTALRVRSPTIRTFDRLDAIEQAAMLAFEDDRQAKIAEFADATRQLQELAARSPIGQIATLPADQREQAAQLQERRFELNREIRDIEAAQRAEINAVESDLRIKNIVLVPVAVVLLGLIVAIWRRVRLANYLRRRAAAA